MKNLIHQQKSSGSKRSIRTTGGQSPLRDSGGNR
jgi:hypothetical protein